MPKAKKAIRKDNPNEFTQYAEGGPVKGLWDNIHAKKERIRKGSGERMRKAGSKGAPTEEALRRSQNRKG